MLLRYEEEQGREASGMKIMLGFFLIFECKEHKIITSQMPWEENVTEDMGCADKCFREIKNDEDR